ncbi:hypothetical protein FDZ71_17265, partial [bacterium]
FVRNEFRRVGIPFSAPTLCTVLLSRKLYPVHRKHSLESIVERHAIDVAGRHRALDDARAVEAFLAIARQEKGEGCYEDALAKLLKIPSLTPGGRRRWRAAFSRGPRLIQRIFESRLLDTAGALRIRSMKTMRKRDKP